jgi:hypothetical protein
MVHVHRIEFQKDAIVVRYTDDEQPKWSEERIGFIHWREHPNATGLARVGISIFRMFVENPEFIAQNDEVIQEWLGKVFNDKTAAEIEDADGGWQA